VVVRTEQIVNARTALYRGWYLVLTDRKDESRPFLEEATQSPTAIAKLARQLLEQAGPAPSREEDRPSLPPMTIPNE
jgi:hypothetical protein